MKRSCEDIRHFFKKSVKVDNPSSSAGSSCYASSSSNYTECVRVREAEPESELNITVPAVSEQNSVGLISELDIAYAVGAETNLDPSMRYKFLKNAWKPANNYEFPIRKEKNQNRRFNIDWLNKFFYLSYSKLKEGAYCRLCVLFSPSTAGVGNQVGA